MSEPQTADPAVTPPAATGTGQSPVEPQAEVTTEANPEGDSPASDAPAIDYDAIQLPDGMEMDTDALEHFKPLFEEAKFDQATVQKLVEKQAAYVQSLTGKGEAAFDTLYQERRQAEIAENSQKWLAQLKADPELANGGFDKAKARIDQAIGAVAEPEFKQFLNDTGLGNHPSMVKLIHKLIDYRPQDLGEGPSGSGNQRRSAAEILFGGDK